MTVEAVVYSEGDVDTRTVDDAADARAVRDAPGTTWLRAWNATPDELAFVAETFAIHDLAMDDVADTGRPRVHEFPDHTFLLLAAATLRRGDTTFANELREDYVGLFLGADWLVTLSTTVVDPVQAVWDAVDRSDRRLLARGPDFTAYRVLDATVDGYYDVLDEIESDIETVEDQVVDQPDAQTLESISSIRRELLSIRRLLWPTRDAVNRLARGDSDQVAETAEKYYRDAYGHVVELVELVETYRDLARGARDIYLNSLSTSTNEVMKALTVVATIVLPLTFVVGVYGMNVDMPELGWEHTYAAIWLGMVGVVAVMVTYFRREGWL
jgi:magnesium transporter